MVSPLIPLSPFSLKRSVQLFVHEPGDEMWLWALIFSLGRMPSFTVPTEPSLVDLHFQASERTSLSREPDDVCQDYEDRMVFAKCVKTNMRRVAMATADCWMPDYEFFLNRSESGLEPCTGGTRNSHLWVRNTHGRTLLSSPQKLASY